MSIRVLRWPMSFSASRLMPVISAASPTTTTTFSFVPRTSRVSARPSAIESPVPACPPSKTSCSLSDATWEAAHAAELAERAEAIESSRQQLVRVRLVARVPDQLVGRRIEQPMKRDGQLHDAEVAAEVPARLGDGPDDRAADLRAQRAQLLLVEALEVARALDAGQK